MTTDTPTVPPSAALVVKPSNLSDLRDRIESALDFGNPETIHAIMCAVASAVKFAKEIQQLAEERAEDYIREHGSFTVDKTAYFIGSKKSPPKCRDAKAVLEKMLELVDVDTVGQCISSNGWKQGAVKAVLASIEQSGEFPKLFDVTPKEKLMIEGPDDAELQIVNLDFVKKKPATSVDLLPDQQP